MSIESRSPSNETAATQEEYERRITAIQRDANIALAERREAQALLNIYREVVAAATAFVDAPPGDVAATHATLTKLVETVEKLRTRPDAF